ncbi:hypothetical protein Anas_09936 [Armadillidium nasatum]|uniref:Uncharacterized protein n=1 Tax=Armadillidium nasatum TaxID=96803 RepID=A0A5N5TK52_9CRUS|nr:hypothetical protein Anas_09936 [Armadillidium nasatum]
MKMIATIAYCVFGMALLSMAINLMQQQIVEKTKWLGKQIGISGEPEDDSWKYKNIIKSDNLLITSSTPMISNGIYISNVLDHIYYNLVSFRAYLYILIDLQ